MSRPRKPKGTALRRHPTAAEAHDAVQALSSTRGELAVHKALTDHKLGEINQAGPSDQAWIELGASMDAVDRVRFVPFGLSKTILAGFSQASSL